jgi:hypothetical protein
MKWILIIASALAFGGCAVTPTDVKSTAPFMSFTRPGKAADLRDCAVLALERDTGFEATSRKTPDGVDIALWGGGLERKTFTVVALADTAAGVQVTAHMTPYGFHSDKAGFSRRIETAIRGC